MKNLQRLYLLRHAQALDARDGQTDFDRILSENGKIEAKKIGKIIKDNDPLPQVILLSPSIRTRETAQYLDLFEKSNLILVNTLYEGSTIDYLNAIYEADTASSLLLIGHNPAIFALLQYIVSPQSNIKIPNSYPTAALAVIDPLTPTFEIRPQSALLTGFYRP